jgi:hypothetical protein
MYVIAHQYVGVDATAGEVSLRQQVAQVFTVMDLVDEAGPPIHGALDDVLGRAWIVGSEGSWH